jgi:hypothetical protein
MNPTSLLQEARSVDHRVALEMRLYEAACPRLSARGLSHRSAGVSAAPGSQHLATVPRTPRKSPDPRSRLAKAGGPAPAPTFAPRLAACPGTAWNGMTSAYQNTASTRDQSHPLGNWIRRAEGAFKTGEFLGQPSSASGQGASYPRRDRDRLRPCASLYGRRPPPGSNHHRVPHRWDVGRALT